MTIFLTVLHVLVCLLLIVIVLLQRGKGAEIGAMFGGGGSATLFGSRGAGNFLTKLTTASAVVFMLTSLGLAYFARQEAKDTLFDGGDKPAAESPFAEPEASEENAGASPFEEVPAAPGAESAASEAPPAAERPTAAGDPGAASETAPTTE